MWNHHEDDVVFKELPYYKTIIKGFLQKQIQNLLEQMSDEAGEESFIMTVNLGSGSMSHLGSRIGKGFLDGREDLKSQFFAYCISNYDQSSFGNPNTGTHQDEPPVKRRRKKPSRKMNLQEDDDPKNRIVFSRTHVPAKHVSETDQFKEFMKAMEKSHNIATDEKLEDNTHSVNSSKDMSDEHVNNTGFKHESPSTNYQGDISGTSEWFDPELQNMDRTPDSSNREAQEEFDFLKPDLYPESRKGMSEIVEKLSDTMAKNHDEANDVEPLVNSSNKYLSTEGVVTLTKQGHVMRHKKAEKPRLMLTFSEKFQILKDIEANPHLSHRELAKKNNVGRSTIGLISKNRNYYKAQYQIYAESPRKKFKTTKYNTINDAVWNWYSEAKTSGLLVSGTMVREKALEIAKDLSEPTFKASNGWLGSWQNRYNVKTFRVTEECKSKAISVSAWTSYPKFDTEAVGAEGDANQGEGITEQNISQHILDLPNFNENDNQNYN